jgi:hypothetical protein
MSGRRRPSKKKKEKEKKKRKEKKEIGQDKSRECERH